MAKSFSFLGKATIPVVACFLTASLAGVASAGGKAQLSGHWNFNPNQSDDADRKVHEAQINNTRDVNDAAGGGADPTAGTGGPGGGGYPGGGGGYPIGGMGRGGMGGMGGMGGTRRGGARNGTRGPEVTDEEWDRLAANPKYLHIDQHSDQLVVTNDSDQGETFYLDGKKHDDKDVSGKKITTKADWEGDSLVAETKLSRAQKITETFRVSDNGKQLFVTTRFEDTSLKGPVSIQRVYDLGKAAAN